MNSEFLQLTVIKMPERRPSLLIFAPSRKPKCDVTEEGGKDAGTMRGARWHVDPSSLAYQVLHGGMLGQIAMIRDKVGTPGARGPADRGPHHYLTSAIRSAFLETGLP
jgi:hypothetical protein